MDKQKTVEKILPGRRFGRWLQKSFAAVCTALLFVSWFGAADVLAADSYETTYKVMIYSGDKGTFNGTGCVSGAGTAALAGADTIVVSDLHYGDTININVSSTNGTIALNPEDGGKYQPTGTRRSGRDNSEAFDLENMTSPSRVYTVTSDRTFVVTYGVPGKMVPYTVSYVLEGTTNPVPGSEAQTFYGAAGEKPVVSAPYFEGYTPVYKAITGTLKQGQDNAWVFEYRQDAVQTATPSQGDGNQTGTTTTAGTTEGTTTGTTAGTDAGTTAGTDADTTAGTASGTNEGETVEVEDEETPTDLLDLDDQEVPMSNVDLDDSGKNKEEKPSEAKRLPIFTGIGAVTAVLLLVLAGVIIKKRKSL